MRAAFRRQRQGDCRMEASLGYTAYSKLAGDTQQGPVSTNEDLGLEKWLFCRRPRFSS